ncbi:MAG: hypothetical protein V1820_01900 [archaeon]
MENDQESHKSRFKDFVPYALGIFAISVAILFLLPKWQPLPPKLEFVDGRVVQAAQGQTIVEMTLSWSAPHTGNCYLANDVRPAGAAKGVPETSEWSQNHLIRYNLKNGQTLVEYWINVEVLDSRTSTKTFNYIVENPPTGTTALDLYSELKCDDKSLLTAKKTAEFVPAIQ